MHPLLFDIINKELNLNISFKDFNPLKTESKKQLILNAAKEKIKSHQNSNMEKFGMPLEEFRNLNDIDKHRLMLIKAKQSRN